MNSLLATNDTQDLLNTSIQKDTPRENHDRVLFSANEKEDVVQFRCFKHRNQSIALICTYDLCEKNLECPSCILENPMHVTQHKTFLYTITEFLNNNKSSLLEIKIEREFAMIIADLTNVLNTVKNEIKLLVQSQESAKVTFSDSTNISRTMCQLSKTQIRRSGESLKTFAKSLGHFEKAKTEKEPSPKVSESELRILNFIEHIRSNFEKTQRALTQQVSTFFETGKSGKPSSNQPTLMNLQPSTSHNTSKVNLLSDNSLNSDENLRISQNGEEYIVQQDNDLLDMSINTKNINSSSAGHIKNFYPLLSRNPVEDIPQNTSISYNNSNQVAIPKKGVRPIPEFPPISNKAIIETLKIHGPFVHPQTQNKILNISINSSFSLASCKYGPLRLENGDIYEGDWQDGKKWGNGKMLSVLGFYYEGAWNNDMAHGRGRMINLNGDMYEGEWVNGKYHGKGVFVGVNGYKYVGEWSQDMQHGYGSEYWPDGSSFEGEYKWSKKHGNGVFKWANGEKYTGEFCLNNLHGNGIYEWPNGQKYIGVWKENKIAGEGKLETPKNTQKGSIVEKKIFASPDCATFKKDAKVKNPETENIPPPEDAGTEVLNRGTVTMADASKKDNSQTFVKKSEDSALDEVKKKYSSVTLSQKDIAALVGLDKNKL